jgi:glycosyltransferase involved in cell wall biosynthesis
MRLAYVVQRYGEKIAGGSEQHCREFAERMVGRGHDVDVVTTCAMSYVDWANVYPAGLSELNGVHIHRLPTAFPRDPARFSALHARVFTAQRPPPLELQHEWMRLQGPYAPELPRWLRRRRGSYDCVVFVTYLFWTTWAGVRSVAGVVPTLLHATAHDERPLRLAVFDEVMRLPDAFAFLSPEESDLVAERFPGAPGGAVIGIGVELDGRPDPGSFRRQFGLGNSPYLCCVGRIDVMKGAAELVDYFIAYKDRHDEDLRLVLVGERLMDVPDRDDIVLTGFVDASVRDAAIADSLCLVHPSYFESFSMVLIEAFATARPALVQRACAVTNGHANRSRGAIAYQGYAEFEAAVELLLERPDLVAHLGRNGRRYVEHEYSWPAVLDRYERLLTETVASFDAPRLSHA